MATINDIIFIIQLFLIIGVTLLKIFNLLNGGKFFIKKDNDKLFTLSVMIIGFLIVLFSWLFGLFIVTLELETTLYATIFNLENYLLRVNIFILIVELFLLVRISTPQDQQAYRSIDNKFN